MNTKSDDQFIVIEATIEVNNQEVDRNQVKNDEKLTTTDDTRRSSDLTVSQTIDHSTNIFLPNTERGYITKFEILLE